MEEQEKPIDRNVNGVDDRFELEEKQWSARKKFATWSWKAAIALIFGSLAIGLLWPEKVTTLSALMDVIGWGIAGLFALVGTFMGVQTWWDIKKTNRE